MGRRWYWAWGKIDEGNPFIVRGFGIFWIYRAADRLTTWPDGHGWKWGGWNRD